MDAQQVIAADPASAKAAQRVDYHSREVSSIEERLKMIPYRARGVLAQELTQKKAALTEAEASYRKAANLAVRTARLAERGEAAKALQVRVDVQRAEAAAQLEAEVRAATFGAWQGTKQQFEEAWPTIYQDYLAARAMKNLEKLRRSSPAAGVI